MRHTSLLVYLVALMLLVPKPVMAEEDNANVKWWWAKYQTVGHHDPKWDAFVLEGMRGWQGENKDLAASVVSLKKALNLGCECPIVKFIYGRNCSVLDYDTNIVRKALTESLTAAGNKPELEFIRALDLNILGFQYLRTHEFEKAVESFSGAVAIKNKDVDPEVTREAARKLRQATSMARNTVKVRTILLPPHATKEQVKEYAVRILKAGGAMKIGDTQSSDDPQVQKLIEMGPENLDVLIEAMREVPDSQFYVKAAIRRLVRPEHKGLVLASLAEEPELIGIVLDQGWLPDAKPVLLEELAAHPSFLPPDWIKAVALLQDAETYDYLRWYLGNGPNASSTYNAIRDLPGLDLRPALLAAWRNKPNDNYDSPPLAAHGVEAGLIECLDYVFAVLKNGMNGWWSGKPPRELILQFTEARGDDAQLIAWYEANRAALVFDVETRRFRAEPALVAKAEADRQALDKAVAALTEQAPPTPRHRPLPAVSLELPGGQAQDGFNLNKRQNTDEALPASGAAPIAAAENDGGASGELTRAEALLARDMPLDALQHTSKALAAAPEDPDVILVHLNVLHRLKNFRAVEQHGPIGIASAMKLNKEALAVSLLEVYAQSFKDAMQADRGATLSDERSFVQTARTVAETYPTSVRATAAYVRILRGCRGKLAPGYAEVRRVAPRAIRSAYERGLWQMTCDLAEAYDWSLEPWKWRERTGPSEEEKTATRAEEPAKLFDMAAAAARKLAEADGGVGYEGGSRYLELAVEAKIKFQAQAIGGADYAGALKTFQEYEAAYLKETSERAGTRALAEEWAKTSSVASIAGTLISALLDTEYRQTALELSNRYDMRKKSELRHADELYATGTEYNKERALRIYEQWGEEPRIADAKEIRLARARSDINLHRELLAHDEKAVRAALTDRAKLALLTENMREHADRYITAALMLERFEEAFNTAERMQARALRDLVGAMPSERAGRTNAGVEKPVGTVASIGTAGDRSAAPEAGQRDIVVQGNLGAGLQAPLPVDEREVASARETAPLGVDQIQRALDDDTTLVFVYASSIYGVPETWGFLATVSKKEFFVVPAKGLLSQNYVLQAKCGEFRGLLESAARKPWTEAQREQFRKVSHLLYHEIIAPLQGHLATRRLVIVPTRDLYQIPFGLLLDNADRYLAEGFIISYAPSATVLDSCLKRHRELGNRVSVIANPALSEAGAALKFAEKEADAIVALWPDAKRWVGADATEKSLREALSFSDIIHLACHTVSDPKDPLAFALALAPDAEHDGRVTTSELLTMQTQAQLVTLSACSTGRGLISMGGQEVIGMLRAWMFAGVPSVVASLWQVDDRATSELMGEFYKNLKTMSRAEALQKAQMAMMKKYDNPYYWGAFVLYGDYR